MIRPEILNNSWPQKTLGEVADFLDSRRKPITAKNRVPGPYPYFGANGQQDSVADYIFDEPLILLAEDGGHFGDPQKTIAYRVDGKCWVNNHAHVLRAKKNIDIDFLCRHLEKYDVGKFINGATRKKLNKSSALKIPITLPPLTEQKRIAAILDKADAIRRKRQATIKLADDFLRATFLHMFGDPVTNPKGWEVINTIDVCDCIVPGRDKPKSFTGNIPWVTTDDLINKQTTICSKKQIGLTENEISQVRARVIPKGSVLMTCVGDLGLVSIAGIDCVVNQQLHTFQCSDNINNIFLMYNVSFQKPYMYKMATSTTVPYLNKTKCNNMPLIFPPLELQQEFTNRHISVSKFKHKLQRQFILERNLFNSLAQRAFRGEL